MAINYFKPYGAILLDGGFFKKFEIYWEQN